MTDTHTEGQRYKDLLHIFSAAIHLLNLFKRFLLCRVQTPFLLLLTKKQIITAVPATAAPVDS